MQDAFGALDGFKQVEVDRANQKADLVVDAGTLITQDLLAEALHGEQIKVEGFEKISQPESKKD